MFRFVLCCALMFYVSITQAQESTLTIEKIMQDTDEWVGGQPGMPSWSEDGQTLYFWWNPDGQFPSDSLFKVPRTGGEPEQVSPEERRTRGPTFSGWHHGEHVYDWDFSRKVYEQDGDIYLYDRERDERTRLTRTQDREYNPRFALDQQHVIYRRDNVLYRLHLETGRTEQLTDLREGDAPEDEELSEKDAFLKQQQLDLFETLHEQKEQREEREAAEERDRKADDPPPTFHYGDWSVQQLQIDPSERFVTFVLRQQPPDQTPTEVMAYVTETGHAEPLPARPKVGTPPSDFELYVQDLERDTTYQIDLHHLEGAYDIPAYRQEQGVELDSTEAKRDLFAFGPYWSGDGEYAVMEVQAYDNKDRWIVRLDPESGELTILDRQHDEAWIGGPGIPGRGAASNVGWLPDNRHFFFQSEATGFSHLYTVDVSTGEVAQLTAGEFEIFSPLITRDGSEWIFLSSEASAFVRHVYTMPIDGGERTRITSAEGMKQAAIHPDEDQLAIRYSYINEPWDIYLTDLSSGAENMERITDSPTEEWRAYDWREGDLMWYEASDGIDVPAQLFEPEEPNGAAVLFVHGAGYLQNVHKGWSQYFREYMFHNMLADLGYTVMNVDFRASAGYGRDWRTAIYRHMGGRDLQDYVDASRYLRDEHGIPPENVFIYGGSYGGFITLMALFTEAEHFGGGAALRSVTDWVHYNHGYTSNILNAPATDSLAFVRSSPIYFAEGLEDPLLMTHGLVDVNVQPQDIFRLSQRLIELGKTDWELAMYPVEDHGFVEPSSWADQYRRIFEWIQRSVGPEAQEPPGREVDD